MYRALWTSTLLALLALLAAGACADAAPPTSTPPAAAPALEAVSPSASAACPVTRAAPLELVPAEAARPIVSGSSHPDVVRANLSMAGNDAIWVTVPRGPVALHDRLFVVRLVPGRIAATGQRIDGAAPLPTLDVLDGYGDVGLQLVGFSLPAPGCWELTFLLDGVVSTELTVTVLARAGPP